MYRYIKVSRKEVLAVLEDLRAVQSLSRTLKCGLKPRNPETFLRRGNPET